MGIICCFLLSFNCLLRNVSRVIRFQLQLTTLDMLVFIILTNVFPDHRHIRYSRVLRAVLIVNFSDGRQVHITKTRPYNILATLIKFSNSAFLVSFYKNRVFTPAEK